MGRESADGNATPSGLRLRELMALSQGCQSAILG